MTANDRAALDRLRKIALALPEAHEVEAWGAPTFRVKNKLYAMYSSGHYSEGRAGVWIKASKENQELMVRDRPDLFFKPPYVGASGWVGMWLDKKPEWGELALLLEDAWRTIAPKKLVASHDAGEPPAAAPARRPKPHKHK